MSYFKVNTSTGEILSEQLTTVDPELHGLSDETLADLGAAFPDRSGFRGVGYWPAVQEYLEVPDGKMLSDTRTHVADLQGKRVISTRELIDIPASVLRGSLLEKLTASDAAFQARWIEDLAAGHQYSSFTAWQRGRAALRAQLAALTS